MPLILGRHAQDLLTPKSILLRFFFVLRASWDNGLRISKEVKLINILGVQRTDTFLSFVLLCTMVHFSTAATLVQTNGYVTAD